MQQKSQLKKIPKTIHYCWFGKAKKSKLILECLATWKSHLPDYEIIEWNESNVNFDSEFVIKAYELKKWAFVSDYIRLKILYEYGGIYLDTDMFLIRSLNDFLDDFCFLGYEEEHLISAGIIGAQKGNLFIKNCLDFYKSYGLTATSNFHSITIPLLLTKEYQEKKLLQKEIHIYPTAYFYPFPNSQKKDILNFKKYIQPNTYAIHLWNASWVEYDEFYYIRNGNYIKALSKIAQTLFIKKTFNLYYFKRIYYNLLKRFE